MFFYPFSVKIMLKMHQKPFGCRAPHGPAGADPLAAIWGLLLRGGEREGRRKGEGRGREGRGRRERAPNRRLSVLVNANIICTGLVKPKKYDWKDSNLALFGSDTEKQVKSENTILFICILCNFTLFVFYYRINVYICRAAF